MKLMVLLILTVEKFNKTYEYGKLAGGKLEDL